MAPSAAKAELATDQEPQMHVYKTAIKLTNCRTNLSSNKPPTTAAAQTKQDSKLLNNNPQTTDTCQAQLSGGEEIKFIGSQRIYRHFVELFKPRCEHCNCLILDEECTEAEGKVWHINHFCCTECQVPLGGQQYIIVDASKSAAKSRGARPAPADHKEHQTDSGKAATLEVEGGTISSQQQPQQHPYCLKCFDQVFGETCEECGKLITCYLGAIIHERRCWHASPACFKCRRCSKSLLGCPFLPSLDGFIYCSAKCSDSVSAPGKDDASKLSLASYCDPRAAPYGALQHQLAQTERPSGAGQFKASQCSPAASLVSNEGTISDHSATSSGVSTAPPVSSNDGSLKSHSPLSSTSSQSSESSSSSAPSMGADHHLAPSSIKQAHPQSQTRNINSIAATLERRRRVKPITELSVVDLLSVADDQMMNPAQPSGFDGMVSHFADGKRLMVAPQRATQFGANIGQKHQESFFFELAQRLPKMAASIASGSSDNQPDHPSETRVFGAPTQPAAPLDTNGLPTLEAGASPSDDTHATASARSITDHYSTVNKGAKACKQQVVGDSEALNRNNFFAITSPLLSCRTDFSPTSASFSGAVLTADRPASSLSAIPAAPGDGHQSGQQQRQPQLDAALGLTAGQLRRNNSVQQLQSSSNADCQDGSQLLLQHSQSATAMTTKPLTKPAKSVSFDPTVKDPPCSSASMTVGRASALKSALKSSSSCNQQQQQQVQLQLQQQHQFLTAPAGSATMPASLAQHFKASSGSLAAYNAYYDDQGRRIKLSSIIQHQQPQELDDLDTPSRSLLSGALAKLSLGGQSSRGGRREERKLRDQMATVHIAQPMPNLSHQQLFVQPVEPNQQQHPVITQPSSSSANLQYQVDPQAPVVRRRGSRDEPSRSHRHKTRSRKYSRSRHYRRSSGGRRHRSSRYSSEDDSYDSASSRCSTCSSSLSSSSSSCSSCSDDDDELNSSLSSSDECSSEVSSYTSRSSASNVDEHEDRGASSSSSCSSSDCNSRSPSPNRRATRQHSGLSSQASASRSSSGSARGHRRSSSGKHRSRSSGRHSKRRASVSGSCRHQPSRYQRGSSRRSSSRRSSRSSSHSSSSRLSNGGAGSSRRHRHHQASSRHHERKGRGSHAVLVDHHERRNRQHERSHRRASSSHLQLNEPASNRTGAYSAPHHESLILQHSLSQPQLNKLARAKSPSNVSTDSKSANNENCRII